MFSPTLIYFPPRAYLISDMVYSVPQINATHNYFFCFKGIDNKNEFQPYTKGGDTVKVKLDTRKIYLAMAEKGSTATEIARQGDVSQQAVSIALLL